MKHLTEQSINIKHLTLFARINLFATENKYDFKDGDFIVVNGNLKDKYFSFYNYICTIKINKRLTFFK